MDYLNNTWSITIVCILVVIAYVQSIKEKHKTRFNKMLSGAETPEVADLENKTNTSDVINFSKTLFNFSFKL